MTKIMGVLNVSPDSFYEVGKCLNKEDALRHVNEMIEDGVQVLDIGAESTRPGAVPITQEEEISRLKDVLPEVFRLCKEKNVLTSIDSYHLNTIRFALANDVDIINCQKNAVQIAREFKESSKKIVLMHSLSIPTRVDLVLPEGSDVIKVLKEWFISNISELQNLGISRSDIILDPGLGFGKTSEQCWEIIRQIDIFKEFSLPMIVGASHKRYMKIDGEDYTLVLGAIMMAKQIDFLRVHDVKQHAVVMNHFIKQ